MAEWVGLGRYPIALGLSSTQIATLAEQGVTSNIAGLREGAKSPGIGVGGLMVINRGPHPNATRVFINWILARDVQAPLMQRLNLNSRRADVPIVDPEGAVDMNRISEYVPNQYEKYLPLRRRAQEPAQQLLP